MGAYGGRRVGESICRLGLSAVCRAYVCGNGDAAFNGGAFSERCLGTQDSGSSTCVVRRLLRNQRWWVTTAFLLQLCVSSWLRGLRWLAAGPRVDGDEGDGLESLGLAGVDRCDTIRPVAPVGLHHGFHLIPCAIPWPTLVSAAAAAVPVLAINRLQSIKVQTEFSLFPSFAHGPIPHLVLAPRVCPL